MTQPSVIIQALTVGDLETNCYIVGCPGEHVGLVIDPGGSAASILEAIRAKDLTIQYVVNTHAHIDHTAANSEVLKATGARLAIHEADAPTLNDSQGSLAFFLGRRPPADPVDRKLKEGDEIEFGSCSLSVLHTPGHTPGGITLVSVGVAFTGDTLFYRGVGRTDLPGGDWEVLQRSIREKLLILPAATVAYPGHGPQTTIGEERQLNPFVDATL